MQSSAFPPWLRLRSSAVALATACAFVAGCAETDPTATIVTVARPTSNPQIARDRDTAWIYHLAKTRDVDALATRLDRERAAERAERSNVASAQVFASSPPRSAPPIAVIPSGVETAKAVAPAAPTAVPGNPLAALVEPPLDPAVALALFTIDPPTYRRLFIENYPVTAEGVNGDYGARLARARLRGGVAAPIGSLAAAAASGDEIAYAKLLEASSVANGPIADAYARAIASLTKRDPTSFLPLLVRLPMETRLAVVSNEAGWCETPPRAILDSAPEDLDQLALARALRVTQTDCARRRADAHRVHRARHGKRSKGRTRHTKTKV